MPRDATPSPVTVTAWLDGRVFIAITCAPKDAGGPIAPCLVTVRMGGRAPPRMEAVSARQDFGGPCAREFALLGSMDIAVTRIALSAFTLMDRVTTSPDTVTVCRGFLGHFVTKCALAGGMEKAVQNSVYAATTPPVTPSMARVSATLAGLAATALTNVLPVSGVQTVSTHVTVTMMPSAAHTTGNANVRLDGRGCTVRRGAHQPFLERTVPMSASAITEPTVTTSLGSAHVGQDSQANTASRSAHREPLATAAGSCASVRTTPRVTTSRGPATATLASKASAATRLL